MDTRDKMHIKSYETTSTTSICSNTDRHPIGYASITAISQSIEPPESSKRMHDFHLCIIK